MEDCPCFRQEGFDDGGTTLIVQTVPSDHGQVDHVLVLVGKHSFLRIWDFRILLLREGWDFKRSHRTSHVCIRAVSSSTVLFFANVGQLHNLSGRKQGAGLAVFLFVKA